MDENTPVSFAQRSAPHVLPPDPTGLLDRLNLRLCFHVHGLPRQVRTNPPPDKTIKRDPCLDKTINWDTASIKLSTERAHGRLLRQRNARRIRSDDQYSVARSGHVAAAQCPARAGAQRCPFA